MLNLNATSRSGGGGGGGGGGGDSRGGGDEVYKVLVMDRFCFDVVTPLVRDARSLPGGGVTRLVNAMHRRSIMAVSSSGVHRE
jgi:hypothetical protein